MSKKRRREKMEARPTTTAERVHNNDNGLLWRIVKDYPDIFNTHVVTKLNGNDVKFFYDVNSESRRAIKQSSNVNCLLHSRLEILTRRRPYRGLWRSVLKRRKGFVHVWLLMEA